MKKSALTKEEMRAYSLLRRLAFPELINAASKASYYRNREHNLELNRQWYKSHGSYNRARLKRYRLQDPERYKNYDRKRRKQNADYKRKRRRLYINVRLAESLGARVRCLVSGKDKSARTVQLLGCSLESFKLYLESRFESGMSWENYGRGDGKWNIDHIMPCAIFDLSKSEHQRRCFHFSNLQPMWGTENLRKNCKVFSDQFNLL